MISVSLPFVASGPVTFSLYQRLARLLLRFIAFVFYRSTRPSGSNFRVDIAAFCGQKARLELCIAFHSLRGVEETQASIDARC